MTPTERAAMEAARDALRPFYNAVFNDNGDITVSGHYDHDEAVRGYFAYRAIEAALSARKETGPMSDTSMSFGHALDALKSGKKVTRAEWRERTSRWRKGVVVSEPPIDWLVADPEYAGYPGGNLMQVVETPSGPSDSYWIPRQSDVFADDWMIVEG